MGGTEKTSAYTSSSEENIMIKFLESKKQSLFHIIQEVYNLSLKVSDPAYHIPFLARTQTLDKTRADYVETVDKLLIEQFKENPAAEPSYSILNTFDELYCFIKQKETTLRQQLEVQNKNNNFNIKLPPLQLTGFDGTPGKWPVFYENFRSVIHNNTQLTNAEKIQYLIGCLSGKALNICSGISPTSQNYDIIWQALLAKYQDTRVQASMYLDKMINQRPGQSADNLLDNFCTAEAALQQLQIDNLADFMITHIALSKLDKSTLNLFEQAHRHIDIPKFAELKKFLSEQSKLTALHGPTPSSTQSSNKQFSKPAPQLPQINKTKAFHSQIAAPQVSNKYDNNHNLQTQQFQLCKVCNANSSHPLFKCEYFLNQNTQTRNDIVRQHSFCINCLGFHHVNTCKSTNKCSSCNRKHHSLLHYETNNNNFNINRPQRSADFQHTVISQNHNKTIPPARYQSTAQFTSPPPQAGDATVAGAGARYPSHSHSQPPRPPLVNTARTYDNQAQSSSWRETSNVDMHLPMADEYYYAPGEIDCLIGNELFPLLLGSNKSTSPNSSVVGIETTLGYVAMEKKLDSFDLRADYNATIQTYIDQGYLSKVPNNFQDDNVYYIPHKAVYRPEKETSKLALFSMLAVKPHQLAADSRDTYPLAAYETENHMYVDDYVSSIDSLDNAEKTYEEMISMFKSGGFNLVKWISNDKELMSRIPTSHKSPLVVKFDDDPNADTKIIGMQWQPNDDNFQFKINIDLPQKCTKRSILSVTARLFDPLGLISPVVAYMKLLIQECWKLQLDWDDEVPDSIVSKWENFHKELPLLSELKIPRHIGINSIHRISLIGCADASEKCYGAVIYVRIDSNDNSPAESVKLLTSKSRFQLRIKRSHD
ncbi:uncharacterized protein [Choristoneura fumiferana]|uniref:uncharacterized protein n=1 Tax=Choristoneura fumiferana TaxID=7141 RepID=UPI003D15A349